MLLELTPVAYFWMQAGKFCLWSNLAAVLFLCGCTPLLLPTRHTEAAEVNVKSSQNTHHAILRKSLKLPIFEYSYRPDRSGTRISHLDNKPDPGIGLNYDFHYDARAPAHVQTGFFKNSRRTWSTVERKRFQFKLNDRWQLAADLPSIQNHAYGNVLDYIVPVPRLTYESGRVKLSTSYIPRVQDYNLTAALGIYLTIAL